MSGGPGQPILPFNALNPGADMAFAQTSRAALKAPLLAACLALGACSSAELPSLELPSLSMPSLSMPSLPSVELPRVGSLFEPFMGPTPVPANESLTMQRVRGGNPAVEPLAPEPGNVWPAQEAPRAALLGGPEEAFRNIPTYTPQLITPVQPAQSPVATPGVPRGPVGDVTPPSRVSVSPASGIRPGQQSPLAGGAVIRDGNVETWIGPDGRTHTRIVTD